MGKHALARDAMTDAQDLPTLFHIQVQHVQLLNLARKDGSISLRVGLGSANFAYEGKAEIR
jgi:hypothetical protein